MGVEWVSALLALLYLEKEGKRLAEKKGRGKIVTLAEEILKDPIEKAGYLLWDVDFYKEGADFNLLVGQTSSFFYGCIISGKSGKWRELSRTLQHGHLRSSR